MIQTYKDFDKNFQLTTDVVIIGSGCGGAVMAEKLSSVGHDVVVCEAGSHYTVKDYGKFKPTESLKKMFYDYGGSLAFGLKDSPSIAIQQGKCVGGSSVVNGGVCFRTPSFIIDHWRDKLGLKEFTHQELESAFKEVEKINSVSKTASYLNCKGAAKIASIVKKKGYKSGQIDRNVKGCDGCARCIFGCPHDAKKSVLLTYLEMAQKNGTTIFANCKINRIIRKGDVATAVEGDIIHPESNRKICKVKIKAKLIIVAASATHTPLLLQKLGIGKASKQLGKNLTLHPASRVYGIFPEIFDSWQGAFQSFAMEEFRTEGIHNVNVLLPPNLLAPTLPGVGQRGYEVLQEMRSLSLFGIMVSDSSSGSVHRYGKGSFMTYTMNEKDKRTFIKAFKIIGSMFFEAGAKKIYLPFFSNSEVKNQDDLQALQLENLDPKQWEVTSAHPMGTCKIGLDEKDSVLDQWHKVHQLKNVYVTDSSAIPSSVAVNPQITIMGLATRVGWYLADNPSWKTLL